MPREVYRLGGGWSLQDWEEKGIQPKDVVRRIEAEELAEKYAGDWLVGLFAPFGIREVLESEVMILGMYLKQSYLDVMAMPVSRRRRLVEKVEDMVRERV